LAFASIKRPTKSNKSKIVTFRLTKDEHAALTCLKKDLVFRSTRDLVIFCMDVVEQLHRWHCSKHCFYIGKPNKKDFKEVEFEFNPDV
jgi:hypothetical protein